MSTSTVQSVQSESERMLEDRTIHDDPDANIPVLDPDRMRPKLKAFKSVRIKIIINEVLNDVLKDKTYTPGEVRDWMRQISDTINERCKELNMYRYRHVVQVMLTQQMGAGCQYIARCRWDVECDNEVTGQFSNKTMVCVVTVFGVYLY